MIDLHTHTVFSDGALIPAELVQRAEVKGLKAIAITDHTDSSNLDLILPRVLKAVGDLNRHHGIRALAGVELTHLPPDMIAPLTNQARQMGAHLVVMHGESPVEPVAPGTNRAAIEAGVDILAHPGLITPEEVEMAVRQGVCLEISGRKGHSLANGHVANLARRLGARLVINSDAHEPSDLMSPEFTTRVGLFAGLSQEEVRAALDNSRALAAKALGVDF
jgi:histidinol phosphatase-like PHP family hydrolase